MTLESLKVEPHVYWPNYEAMGDCVTCGHLEDSPLHLRSHEPPRNSGEGTAVNGPMPLAGESDAGE